jgi:hypothetical protein
VPVGAQADRFDDFPPKGFNPVHVMQPDPEKPATKEMIHFVLQL